jgi:hypothetical protein
MIGIEDHLVGNGDRQGIIEDRQEDLEVDEVEVVVEGIEMVVEMEEEVVGEGEGPHLEVLRPKELFHWKRGRLNIHSGIFDPCNSKESVPWPLK